MRWIATLLLFLLLASLAVAQTIPALTAVSYKLPVGWTEKRQDDVITLSGSSGDSSSGVSTCILVIAPGSGKQGSLQGALLASWQSLVMPTFAGDAHPLVYARHLGNGMNCAFASADMKVKSNNGSVTATMFLIDAGSGFFPVVAIYNGDVATHLSELEQFFTSLRIAGATPSAPLVTPRDLAGAWSTQVTSLASFVTPGGAYAGDASMAYGQTLTFRPDGTYTSHFAGVGGGHTVQASEAGNFKIDGDKLILTQKGGSVTRKRFLGIVRSPDGKSKMLVLLGEGYDLRDANIRLYGEKFGYLTK